MKVCVYKSSKTYNVYIINFQLHLSFKILWGFIWGGSVYSISNRFYGVKEFLSLKNGDYDFFSYCQFYNTVHNMTAM